MQQLQYDINTYLTSVRMSSKIRVLVEGRDDKSHISNVVSLLCKNAKFKVDIAADIKGICKDTGKNNRAKVEKAHQLSKGNPQYKKLFFLCDRESRGFIIDKYVHDELSEHYVDGQLSWTIGHSIENYFLNSEIISNGLRYLTPSALKDQAINLFHQCFPSSIRAIATLTLAARAFGNASYPCGVINRHNIEIDNNQNISIDFSTINNPAIPKFEALYKSFEECINSSEIDVCTRLCRGHTAIVILKRIFAACLFRTLSDSGDDAAEYEANIFENINETSISNALSEAWIRKISSGEAVYPTPLVDAVSSISAQRHT
jgi:hypothetical protein